MSNIDDRAHWWWKERPKTILSYFIAITAPSGLTAR